ncbi:IS66-like element ISCwa4 family transposase [Crocosphaera watsonii]|uniref:Transposase IS66 n=2 Tax=Crocosphaera watsonii WH 8501 TaxID=165597 RepID=Q4C2E5_CROWT|nr:IS66-like element ISCwa4 family transposase [Crocosphaera watsonii]EAM50311.1 Transposase IS66 [Crocosphaera watsonii WH 8501]
MGVMTTNATIDSKLVRAIADEQLANNVFMIEWLVKAQQQLSLQQRLIDQQQQQISTQQQEIEKLKEERDKLKNRNSKNSSVPPSSDQLKKPSDKKKRKKGFKRGPKYDHPGKTRNGFGQPDKIVPLELENCPVCGGSVERDEVVPEKVQQVAEVVDQPIEIREYRRGFYKCPSCGWSDYSPVPLGVKEGFSYGARLSSIVGWLGYGGNLTWRKQEHFIEYVFGIPISQGSLAKMHKWFQESLEPLTKKWLKYIQQPGIRCVDETSYCIDGIKYWVWVATSNEVCVLILAPTRSSAEVEKLLGADFKGILTSDCYSAYFRQSAMAKQKCLAHLERELESLKTSRFQANREFAADVQQVLATARIHYRHYHARNLTLEDLGSKRTEVENSLQKIFKATPKKGWPYDAQRLINRLKRHWEEWFTFLTYPEVKPDNNDAERALRPIVIHRKVSGGARSDWGAELVTQMFSFLETMRLQGQNAIVQLCELFSLAGRSPPGLEM